MKNKHDVNLGIAIFVAGLAMSIAVLFGGCTTSQKAWIVQQIDEWAEYEPEEPDTPQEPAKPSDHIVNKVSKWWGGVEMSGATVDPNYKLTVSRDGRTWSEMPSDWRTSARMLFPAMCVAVYQLPDGTYAGGKYEWLPRPPRTRSWSNIINGYNGWQAPPRGTKMYVFAYTFDGHRVSNTVETEF